jgi:hypothetical protein
MKKRLIFFIIQLAFTNVSYASFPISDTLEVKQDIIQTEEIKQYHYSLQKMGVDLNSCKCVSCRGGIAPLVSKPKPLPIKTKNVKEFEEREPNGSFYAFLSILSALGAIVFTLLTLGSALQHNGNPFPFLLLTLASIGSTIFSTIQARKKGASWGKAVLGLGIVILGVLLIMVLIA